MNVEPFAVSLTDPLETARGTIDRREGFLVSVSVDGVRGIGEATPLPGWTESLAACRRALREAPSDPGEALETLDPETTPAARHGVETALLDARGRARDVPAYRLLAAGDRETDSTAESSPPVERVPVNATIGDAAGDHLVATARAAVDAGFECLKIKVATGSLDRDLERLSALREAVGGSIRIRADANGGWDRSTAEEAIAALRALECPLLEQPLSPDALEEHAELRDRGVRIGLDEGAIRHRPEAIAAAQAADAVVCKPMALGGPVRATAVARRAWNCDLTAIVSTTVDAAIGRAAAVHVAAAIPVLEPAGLATGDRIADDVAPDPAPIESGAATVPQDGGLGVEVRVEP